MKLLLFVVGVVLFLDIADAYSNMFVSEKTKADDGKWYYVQTFFKANWFKAFQFCRYNGMNLLTLQTEADQTRVDKLIKSLGRDSDTFWTSGTDLNADKKFAWMGDGRFIEKPLWGTAEPNNYQNRSEHCVTLTKYGTAMKLNDDVCAAVNYFICERLKDQSY